MDSIKLEKLITENMKSVFGFALTRLGNVTEAEDLASDILFNILRSADKLKDEDRFFGYMWKIADNTYADYLRKKARQGRYRLELDGDIADVEDSPFDVILKNEEMNVLRRELSLLSKQYREATVLYYIEDLSCSETAERLNISTEMVKYYLFRARKILREGMNMERIYGEKSYNPNYVKIDFWGTKGGEDREYYEFQKRKIKGNILLAAYYTPVTIQEISMELGVSVPYLEDEIKLLCDRQYLVYKNGKYLTNVPLFTLECTDIIKEKMKEITQKTAERFIGIADEFEQRFGERFANENLSRWQKLFLCLWFSLNVTENYVEEKYGELPNDGPYSLVNGGGGQGIVWVYEDTTSEYRTDRGIRGIYNCCSTCNVGGNVIAMNFKQTLNAQHFTGDMTDPMVCTAIDSYDNMPENSKKMLNELGYASMGKANFAVWTAEEYAELQRILKESTEVIVELNSKTIEIAAEVAADLAPTHIRKTAEYVGAFVYRFNSIENLVDALFDMGWVKAVDDKAKPALCVVKN